MSLAINSMEGISMARVKIRIHKGGSFEVETEGFAGNQCRSTVEAISQCINGQCEADEDRGSLPDDPTQYLNF